MISLFARKAVLVVGDEGAMFLGSLKDAEPFFVNGSDAIAAEPLFEAMAQEKQAPLTLVFAGMGQEIKTEALPSVSLFDAALLIQRRLIAAFPSAIFSALYKKTGSRLIMAACHENEALRFWQQALEQRGYAPSSLCLAAIELVPVVKNLLPETVYGWGLLICQHETGGWRQVVTLDGQPVFTRLTPADPYEDEEGVAQTVARDLRALLDYLPRLGFDEADEISVLALLPSHAQEALRNMSLPYMLTLMSPSEAARRLKLEVVMDAETPFCDNLLAALVQKNKVALSLHDEKTRQKKQSQQVVHAVYGFALVLLLAAGFCYSDKVVDLYHLHGQSKTQQAQIIRLQKQIEEASLSLRTDGEPLEAWRQAMERKIFYAAPKPSPWSALDKIDLGDKIRLQSFDWKQSEDGRETLHLVLQAVARPSVVMDHRASDPFADALPKLQSSFAPLYDMKVEHLSTAPLPFETLSNRNSVDDPKALPTASLLFTKVRP